jgi:hypothetical protein
MKTINIIIMIIMLFMTIACDIKPRSSSRRIRTKVEMRPKAIIGNRIVYINGPHDLIMAAKRSSMDSIQLIYYKGSWELLKFESPDIKGTDVTIVTVPMTNILLNDSVQ